MTLKQGKNSTLNNTYKELSIQISLDGLSFCIQNSLTGKVECLRYFSFENKGLNAENLLSEVKEIVEQEEDLSQAFDSLKIVHINNLSTFVPSVVFNEDHLADYLKYNIKILANDFITYDEISNKEMVNVYIPFVNINNFFLDWYGEFEYEHFSTILISNLLSIPVNTSEPKVYIHLLGKNEFQLVVIQQKKLLLYNSFVYNTPEDFIYYLLFTYENLELDTEKIPAIFVGNLEPAHTLFQLAYKYIRFVDIFDLQNTSGKFDHLSKEEIQENFVLLNTIH